MLSRRDDRVPRGRIAAQADEAEAAFHELVIELVGESLQRGEHPEQIRQRLIRYFVQAPALQQADPYEQERVIARLQGIIESVMTDGPRRRGPLHLV